MIQNSSGLFLSITKIYARHNLLHIRTATDIQSLRSQISVCIHILFTVWRRSSGKRNIKKIGTTVNAMGQGNLPACRRLVSPRLEPPVSDRPSQRTNTIDHSACAVWSEKAHFAYQFSNRNVDTNQQSVRRNTCELRVSKIQFRRPVQLLFSTHTYTQEIFNRVI